MYRTIGVKKIIMPINQPESTNRTRGEGPVVGVVGVEVQSSCRQSRCRVMSMVHGWWRGRPEATEATISTFMSIIMSGYCRDVAILL